MQKWESGASQPTPEHIVKIAKNFHISLDEFLLDKSLRIVEENEHEIMPEYSSLHSWEKYSAGFDIEYRQCIEEGLMAEEYLNFFEAIKLLPEGELREGAADIVFRLTRKSEIRKNYPYREPSSYFEILTCRDIVEKSVKKLPDSDILIKKIKGAWYGRISGCLLGKPVEGMRRRELIPFLKKTDNYPMHRYIESSDITENTTRGLCFIPRGNFSDKLDSAPVDDDTNYTVLYQKLIDIYGFDFTSDNVSSLWLKMQPKDAYCTAERVAFCNFVNRYKPPNSAIYKNPYREWIGAEIRGDYFGYINIGNPEKAAEMTFKDACISHTKNGIYGEMFIAAMIDDAGVCDNIIHVIKTGISQIPSESRLYNEIKSMLDDFSNGIGYQEAINKITQKYNDENGYDWCYTVPNARIVTAALLYGEKNFGKSIGLAVQEGFDTDCNGATIGSVLGMMLGINLIDQSWKKPLCGKLQTSIFGVGTTQIDDLVNKTLKHIKENPYCKRT